MTIGEMLKQTEARLKKGGVPGAQTDTEWMVGNVTRYNRVQLMLNKDCDLTPAQEQLIESMVQRRLDREPVQYILGDQYFMNLRLKCDKRALIPRSDTELLAEKCIMLIKKHRKYETFELLDIGTGTGALALSIAKACSNVKATGVDISPDAVALAKENTELCDLSRRVEMLQSDLYSAVQGRRFNGIVSNPPYIPSEVVPELAPEVVRFEPSLALDGGHDGCEYYRRIIEPAPQYILPGGFLAFEAEHFQFDYIAWLIERTGAFDEVHRVPDYEGKYRLCYAIRK